MPDRVMFVQLKTGHNTDKGPAWISVVSFNRTWKTARWHGKTLHRWTGLFDANFYDVETEEESPTWQNAHSAACAEVRSRLWQTGRNSNARRFRDSNQLSQGLFELAAKLIVVVRIGGSR